MIGLLPKRRRFPRYSWAAAVSASVVVIGAAGAAGAARYDASHSRELLAGITIGGMPVGGLSVGEARTLLVQRFDRVLDDPLSVDAGGRLFTTTPREIGARTDALDRLRQAAQASRSLPLLVRVWHRFFDSSISRTYPVKRLVSGDALEGFVSHIASEVSRPAVDAGYEFSGGRLQFTPAREGFQLDRQASKAEIERAVSASDAVATLPGMVLAPAVRAQNLGDVLVVRVGENKLSHYRGDSLVKEYDVATGMPEHPTPLGNFEIVAKRENPDWVNPAHFPGGWGWNLPERIPPGPGNPLGTRAMAISAPGIQIHGTYQSASIGYNVSHGCIRMHIADAEELFDQVGVGTKVLIVKTADLRFPGDAPPPPSQTPEPMAENDASVTPAVRT